MAKTVNMCDTLRQTRTPQEEGSAIKDESDVLKQMHFNVNDETGITWNILT
jgi:hypothetical protein